MPLCDRTGRYRSTYSYTIANEADPAQQETHTGLYGGGYIYGGYADLALPPLGAPAGWILISALLSIEVQECLNAPDGDADDGQ